MDLSERTVTHQTKEVDETKHTDSGGMDETQVVEEVRSPNKIQTWALPLQKKGWIMKHERCLT